MMLSPGTNPIRKPHILTISLPIPPHMNPDGNVLELEVEKASAKGFVLEMYVVDLKKHSEDEVLEALEKMLSDGVYVVVTIGFGLRGNKDLTGVFEKVVNLCVEKGRGAKLGFAVTPQDLVDAATRVLK